MHKTITDSQQFAQVVKEHCEVFEVLLTELNQFLNADFLFLAAVEHARLKAHTLVTLDGEGVIANFSYELDGSPCEKVQGSKTCVFEQGVSEAFQEDILLQQMGIEAYLGIPVATHQGVAQGILVALYKEPIDPEPFSYPFQIFASHIGSLLTSFFTSAKLNEQLELLNELCDITKAGAWEYDLQNGELYWSDEIYDIYAIPRDTDITPELGINHYSEVDRERINHLFSEAMNTGKGYQTECEFVDNNGKQKWIRTSGRVRKNKQGEVISVYGVFEDITREKTLLDNEKYRKEYLGSVLDSMSDAVVTITKTGRILDANNAAGRIFGYRREKMRGIPVANLMPEPHASKHAEYVEHYLATGKGKIMGVGRQLPAVRSNGDIFQMELLLSETTFNDKTIFIGLVRDISERIKTQETIYKAAFIDNVTGLKNRSWFEREVRDIIQRASFQEHWIFCVLVDIDKLSYYNLRYGQVGGDKVIKHVAKCLNEAVSGPLKVYKNGVDSFFILKISRSADAEQLNADKRQLQQKLAELENFEIKLGGKTEYPTVSMASIGTEASKVSYELLVDMLEFACEQAKLNGPSGAYEMDVQAQATYERDKLIKESLLTVTKSGELEIVLQPQFYSETQFKSSEALLRWHSKELGFISPAVFIPFAEESNIILDIGEWVIEQVCQLLSQLQEDGINTQIAINVSGKQIVHPSFKSRLLAITEKWKVSPKLLILELTETALVSDIQLVKDTMLSLNEAGFRFSIDDFGTGYSSLGYLKDMPISELKIDKCFIDEIEHKNSRATIVDLIINMSEALNVKCVAEGVEYKEQYEYLKAHGCDMVQGYLFAKPLKIEDWKQKLLEQEK